MTLEQTHFQADGLSVVFNIKLTCGQKLTSLLVGTIISAVGCVIKLFKMAGIDLSSFWFPLPL